MIRQATSADAPILSKLIIQAMGDLAVKFVNSSDPLMAVGLFEHFAALTANQYSYENALVWEDENGVCGMISGYDGACLHQLREPFHLYIARVYRFEQILEDETQPGEYYIDCLSVLPRSQGKGIARQLIKALVDHAAQLGHSTVGLLVHKSNAQAKKLYTRLGFKVVDQRVFVGDVYEHLQYRIDLADNRAD
ncbi:MAG TPA: GNAT family N-acetyltransferase [Mucilaginibacter sp.]